MIVMIDPLPEVAFYLLFLSPISSLNLSPQSIHQNQPNLD